MVSKEIQEGRWKRGKTGEGAGFLTNIRALGRAACDREWTLTAWLPATLFGMR